MFPQASDDEYSPKKKAKPAPKKAGRKKKGSDSDSDEDWGKSAKGKAKGKAGGGGGQQKGYTRALTLSKDLAKLMGQDTMARHEVVKRVWAIIKERNLYVSTDHHIQECILTTFFPGPEKQAVCDLRWWTHEGDWWETVPNLRHDEIFEKSFFVD